MNILDYVVPKKGWGYLLPQNGASEEEEPPVADSVPPERTGAETQETGPVSAGPAAPSAMEAGTPPQREEAAESVSPAMEASPAPQREETATSAVPAPETPAPALEPSPARADSHSSDGPLEADLRDLFSEASVMDPQLASLLGRIGDMAADDLATELKDFSRAIGADGAGSEGRAPG